MQYTLIIAPLLVLLYPADISPILFIVLKINLIKF